MAAISTASTPPLRHCHPVPNITSSLPRPPAAVRHLPPSGERTKGAFGCAETPTRPSRVFGFVVNNIFGSVWI
uniref:Uncharacterized protein n=1 Tax=Tanacetum cinerariifolium TaxID=118510 RepID=A0A699KI82_TANCI|nr:hypothetical protein [Tanacetum cinerariifolium]